MWLQSRTPLHGIGALDPVSDWRTVSYARSQESSNDRVEGKE